MCGRNWCLVGLCALTLGISILITTVFPKCFLLFIVALLLVFCGVELMKRR